MLNGAAALLRRLASLRQNDAHQDMIMKTILATLALTLFAGAAWAQYPVYQTQVPNGTMLTFPGSGQTGGYGQPTNGGATLYIQQQQPSYQPNPSLQNWQQYQPTQGYNRR
jgi:hypothetical protein